MTTLKENDPHVFKIVDLYENDLKHQLELKEKSELFQIINGLSKREFNPENAIPLKYLYLDGFEKLLNDRAKKLYENTTTSTVFEYETYQGIDQFTSPALYNHYKELGAEYEKRAALVQFISLEAKIETVEDINQCMSRLAVLFSLLVDNNIVLATFNKLIIIPLAKPDHVGFGLWIAVKHINCSRQYERVSSSNFKGLNQVVGFDVFTFEGSLITDFDWKQIDKLK